jgi:hypothetical protein
MCGLATVVIVLSENERTKSVIETVTTSSGLPLIAEGMSKMPPGITTAPTREAVLGWRREPTPSRREDQLWLLGVHGGAGVSTLRRCLDQAGLHAADSGRAWPVPDGRPVIAVARTHGRGIKAAQAVALQYLSGHTPPGVELLGCVLLPDAPGRLPRAAISQVRSQVTGIFGWTLSAPWVEAYRLHDPSVEEPWPPLTEEMSRLATRLTELISSFRDVA